ncbi:SRPBCC family protein [Streptomyces sp. NPDC088729]|uniref:SRPBCC family protein n=1 Tax=Streptomyces sp. NPDC088729 TaxID=3365876 RepID=UPI00382385C7
MSAQGDVASRSWELSESVVVEAPPDQVYAAISDVRRMREWSPECVGVLVYRGRKGPRPSFIGFNRNGARRWFTFCRVTVSDAPGEFAFRVSVAGLPIATWGFRLTPARSDPAGADSESTHVTQYWRDLRRGGRGRAADLLGAAIAGTSPQERVRVNRSGMITTLGRLKRSLEAVPEAE